MMNRIFLIGTLFISAVCSGQKIEQYFDYAWRPTTDPGRSRYYSIIQKEDTLWHREDYYLREKKLQMNGTYKDRETKVAQGAFMYFHANGILDMKGNYVNGKKNGLWLSFYDDGSMKDSIVYDNGEPIGTALSWHRNGYIYDSSVYNKDGSGITVQWFDNGLPSVAGMNIAGRKQNGKWKYYHRNGQMSSVEIYDAGKLIAKEYYDESGKPIKDTTSKDSDPKFPGGIKAWKRYLEKNLSFPEQYKITGSDQAVVVVAWMIDEEGNVQDVHVTDPFHPAFDKIAVDAISDSPKWSPCISHNRKIKFYYKQPLTFAQDE